MSSEDIRKSFTSKKGLFFHPNGTPMNNVEVCAKLYDYAMALQRENATSQFSDKFIDLVKIATDSTLTTGARNAMMSEKLPNNLN
jgi:hypothetical protein